MEPNRVIDENSFVADGKTRGASINLLRGTLIVILFLLEKKSLTSTKFSQKRRRRRNVPNGGEAVAMQRKAVQRKRCTPVPAS